MYDILVIQRTLSSLELPRAVSGTSGQSPSVAVGDPPSVENQDRFGGNAREGSLSLSQYNARTRQKSQDLSIHDVLEKFSLVTKFARDTTSQIFGEANGNGFRPSEKRNNSQSLIDHRRKESDIEESAPDLVPVPSDPVEVTFRSLCINPHLSPETVDLSS